MEKHTNTLGIATGVVALVCLPFWYQGSVGLLLGYACSMAHSWLLARRVDALLAGGPVTALSILGPIAGMAVLALPFALAFAFPAHVAWPAVFVGLIARKAALYIEAFCGGSHDR